MQSNDRVVRRHEPARPNSLNASSHLLAVMASRPLPTAPLLDLMHGYELGVIPTRSAHPTARRKSSGGGRFLRLPYQRAPDRPRAVLRRKRLALTDPVPARIGAQLTEAQRAYARLVRDEWERHGVFDLCHDEAAARIGACAKTAMRAQDRLRELALISVEARPQPGRKHLPNIVRIIAPQWLLWIEHGPKSRPRADRGTSVSSHGSASLNHERLVQLACQKSSGDCIEGQGAAPTGAAKRSGGVEFARSVPP